MHKQWRKWYSTMKKIYEIVLPVFLFWFSSFYVLTYYTLYWEQQMVLVWNKIFCYNKQFNFFLFSNGVLYDAYTQYSPGYFVNEEYLARDASSCFLLNLYGTVSEIFKCIKSVKFTVFFRMALCTLF